MTDLTFSPSSFDINCLHGVILFYAIKLKNNAAEPNSSLTFTNFHSHNLLTKQVACDFGLEPLKIQTMLVMPKRDETIFFEEGEDSESVNEADVVSLSSTSRSGPLRDHPRPVKDAEKRMRNKIINQEEKNVRNARFIVIVAGITCAAAVGAAINIFAHQNDQASFELEVRKR
jgi:hypothetical protein